MLAALAPAVLFDCVPSLRQNSPRLEVIYPRPAIESRLAELAPIVDAWAREAVEKSMDPLLVVCILRGGVFFFSDLLLRMSESVEPGFCRASSYARDSNQAPNEGLQLDLLGLSVHRRHVVFVDNICDSGRTLAACISSAQASGARSVRSVVLVHRQQPGALHAPTLAAFCYSGAEWLAGYGMRDRGALMNFPEVCRVRAGIV